MNRKTVVCPLLFGPFNIYGAFDGRVRRHILKRRVRR
jgi:hypothetical protein